MRMYKSLVPFCCVSFVSFLLYRLFFCFGFAWHCLSLYILETTQTHKLLWFCLRAYWICRLIWGELVQYYFFWCMFTYLSVQVFSSFLQLGFIVFSLGPYISFVRFILLLVLILLWTVQFSSVAQSCPTLCNPMDCSMPGLPVQHHLLELTQTHVHWVGDAVQPSHLLSSPSPPDFSLCQHQGLF